VGITDLWTYVLGTIAIVMLPGPNSLYTLSIAARRGIRAGYRAAFGVFLGDAVLMLFSAAGVASLLKAYPPVFLVIKYAGAAYLVWVGVNLVRSAWRRPRAVAAEPAPEPAPGAGGPGRTAAEDTNPFRRALLISLLNPKAILFFISFFIQFVDPAYPHPALSFLVLALIAEVISAIYLTVLIVTGTALAAQFRRRRRLAAAATTAVGAIFVGFAVKLATG
jgi:leucine efflux protein